MIFVAVGTQLPFDRLVRAVDQWAEQARHHEVVAQIGTGTYVPKFLTWERMIGPEAFRAYVEHCELVVAHAGIGTILSALELGKPVIVLPRKAEYGEHRNDHQLATAERFSTRRLVSVAQDESQLVELLNQFENPPESSRISSEASPELIGNLRQFFEKVGLERTRVRL